jgi:cytochrome c oxidase assembly protein subunit 15
MEAESRSYHRLSLAAWALVIYTVLIIVWGAWVRISGSGDGCGEHWPLCHGAAVPIGASVKTWTEVSHRYSTALFGVLILLQLVAIRRSCSPTHPARFWMWLTLLFTASEALIGRLLVVRGLVNESESLARLYIMPLHLVNTSLLLLSQVMTAEHLRYEGRRLGCGNVRIRWRLVLGTVALLLLLSSGAIAALGSHLSPAASLAAGLADDVRSSSHPAVRLRILHPILGLSLPLLVALTVSYFGTHTESPRLKNMYRNFGILLGFMVLTGVATLSLLAPIWLKLSHLTMANIIVIGSARCLFHTLHAHRSGR